MTAGKDNQLRSLTPHAAGELLTPGQLAAMYVGAAYICRSTENSINMPDATGEAGSVAIAGSVRNFIVVSLYRLRQQDPQKYRQVLQALRYGVWAEGLESTMTALDESTVRTIARSFDKWQ